MTLPVRSPSRSGVRWVGRFHFSVTLPVDVDVDADDVSAQLHDGVLTVHVPKSAQAKPRRIAISS